MKWIDVAPVRCRWQALYNCGNEQSGSIRCWEFLDFEDLLAFQEGLCFNGLNDIIVIIIIIFIISYCTMLPAALWHWNRLSL